MDYQVRYFILKKNNSIDSTYVCFQSSIFEEVLFLIEHGLVDFEFKFKKRPVFKNIFTLNDDLYLVVYKLTNFRFKKYNTEKGIKTNFRI